jgi:hypothetical protein
MAAFEQRQFSDRPRVYLAIPVQAKDTSQSDGDNQIVSVFT